MDMTEQQRRELAARIKAVRLRRYGGNRKAAYTAAGVNSNTWTRAEAGETLAERSLVAIVSTMWPDSGGDWQAIDPPLEGRKLPDEVRAEIEASDLSEETKAAALEALAEKLARAETTASDTQEGVTGA